MPKTRHLETANGYLAAAIRWEQEDQTHRAASSYEKAGVYLYLAKDKFGSASAYCKAAQLYGDVNDVVKKRWCYDFAGGIHQRTGSKMEAAYCFHLAAQACLVEDQLEEAGLFYARAAKLMQDHSPDKAGFVVINYLNSALAYAGCGKEHDYAESYLHFRAAINSKGYEPKDNFYFDKLVKALSDSGLDDLASEVYVEKMDMKVKNEKYWMPKLIYWIWGKTSDYGESWSKWMAYTVGAILFFSLLYFPNPWGRGFLALTMNPGYGYPVWESFGENMTRSLSFSVTVFSTLGFGNVTPANWIAELVVMCEVLFGYGFLAVFITLISRKLMRK